MESLPPSLEQIGGEVTPGDYGDGGPATSALLYFPRGIVVDASGNVYISDTDNYIVRWIATADARHRRRWSGKRGQLHSAKFLPARWPRCLAPILLEAVWRPSPPPLPLSPSLGGVSVLVNGVAAPVLYASTNQINFQIPWETKAGSATVVVSTNGFASTAVNITVQTAAPGLFVQGSHASVQNSDFSLNSSSNPAKVGGTILAYLTGAGAVSNQPPDGAAAGSDPLSKSPRR